jgi:hypothetical protein
MVPVSTSHSPGGSSALARGTDRVACHMGARYGPVPPEHQTARWGDEVLRFTKHRASEAQFVVAEATDLVRKPGITSWGPTVRGPLATRRCKIHARSADFPGPGRCDLDGLPRGASQAARAAMANRLFAIAAQ